MLRWTALILLSVPAIAVSAQQRVDHRLQKPFIVVSDSYWADYSERTGKSRPTSISIYRDGFVDLQLPSAGDASAWVDKRELDALNAYLNAIDWSRLTTKSVEKA